MTPQKIRLVKADLRRPLPGGLSKDQAIDLLRARSAKVRATKSLTSAKKPGKSFVRTGSVGTSFADFRMGQVQRVAAGSGEHNYLASVVERIHSLLRASQTEVASGDHQVLVNITNKIRAASRRTNPKPLKLTVLEQKILKQYYQATTGKELELWK